MHRSMGIATAALLCAGAVQAQPITQAQRAPKPQPVAQRAPEWNHCATARGTPDERIRNCTALIDSARETPKRRALAYNNRGVALSQKGDRDGAIADYDQAIRLDPKLAGAYNGRGLAWSNKGDLDRAISDYDRAIRLAPGHARAYNNRGSAWSARGELVRAIGDYSQAIRLDPKYPIAFYNRGSARSARGDLARASGDFDQAVWLDPKYMEAYKSRGYTRFAAGQFDRAADDFRKAADLADNSYATIWSYLARARLGQDAAADLSAAAARLSSKDWPAPVIEFLLGRRSADDMRAAAGSAAEQCEAAFYLGEWQVLRHNAAEAIVALRSAADTCPKSFVEYASALAELKRLRAAATAPLQSVAPPLAVPAPPQPAPGPARPATPRPAAAPQAVPASSQHAATPPQTAPTTTQSIPTPQTPGVRSQGAAALQSADCAQAETHWKSAEEIRTIPVYEDHLARFGQCAFATLARARIEALRKAQ